MLKWDFTNEEIVAILCFFFVEASRRGPYHPRAGEWHVSFNGPRSGTPTPATREKKLKKASFIRDFMCRLLSAGSAVRLVKNGHRTRSQLVAAYRCLLTPEERSHRSHNKCSRCFGGWLSISFYKLMMTRCNRA